MPFSSLAKTFDANGNSTDCLEIIREACGRIINLRSLSPVSYCLRAVLLWQGKEKVEGVGTGALAAAMAYSNFDVSQLATWRAGEPVPFSFLAKTFDAIANTTKRLEIIKTLVGAFRAILATTPEDLLPIVYLCTNQVRFGYRMTVTCKPVYLYTASRHVVKVLSMVLCMRS